MNDIDDELRSLLQASAGAPALTAREELLATLTARVDAGGAEMADAPAPRVGLELVPPAAPTEDGAAASGASAPVAPGPSRAAARAAGIGVGGWIALAAGAAAAAAAGSWLVGEVTGTGAPSFGDETAPIIVDVRARAPQPALRVVPEVVAEALPANADDPSAVEPILVAPILVDEPRAAAEQEEAGHGEADLGGTPSDGRDPEQHDGAGHAKEGRDHEDATLDVRVGLEDVDDALRDTVDATVPEGALHDTIAPVIAAIDLSGLAGWVVDSLLCGEPAPVGATVSDDAGVDAVSLRISTPGGHTASLPLSRTGTDSWGGTLAPITGLQLGLLDPVVTVEIEARDHAGNVSLKQASARVGIVSCLG